MSDETKRGSWRRLGRLLVADALDGAGELLAAARRIAERTGARIDLVHAVEPRAGWRTLPSAEDGAAAVELTTLRRRQLEREARRAGLEEGRLASVTVEVGPAHRVILAAADRSGSDLVLVGPTRHGSPLARLLGSTADRVVRKSPAPVLIVRPGLRLPVSRVLAPVDLSLFSADAFRCACDLLHELAGERPAVEALLVVEPEAGEEELPLEVLEQAREELESFVDGCGADGRAAVAPRLLTGDPAERIVEAAGEEGCDLVVLGTHGFGGIERWMVGSVALAVARRAPASVLLISPEAVFGSAIAADLESVTSPVGE